MQPYNEQENNWLSRSKTQMIKHFKTHEDVYVILFWVMVLSTAVLGMLTAVDSFFEIISN